MIASKPGLSKGRSLHLRPSPLLANPGGHPFGQRARPRDTRIVENADRLHVTYPSYSQDRGYHIAYRRISPPGQTASDMSAPVVLMANAPAVPRSAITVNGSDVFVFTRAGINGDENVRYFLSRD